MLEIVLTPKTLGSLKAGALGLSFFSLMVKSAPDCWWKLGL